MLAETRLAEILDYKRSHLLRKRDETLSSLDVRIKGLESAASRARTLAPCEPGSPAEVALRKLLEARAAAEMSFEGALQDLEKQLTGSVVSACVQSRAKPEISPLQARLP